MRMGFRHQQQTMEKKGYSSSSSSCGGGGADSVNGLKFGKKIYFEGAGSGLQQEAEAPSSPAKRGRTGVAAQGGQPPRCQVEGCRLDLSDAKAYYCRHKVCGMHSKSPKVIVAGIEQRFCQQCSRFHQLPEFDQGKRSCRRRLAGHNKRRRKPPPGPLLPSHYGSSSTFDNHSKAGGFMMDFSGYSTTVTGRDSWLIPTSRQELTNQVTVAQKYEFSWQSTSQNPLPYNDLLQGLADQPRIPSEGCFDGASNSNTGALSLLSNESWSSRNQRALSLGANNFLGPNMVQPSANDPVGQFPFASWGGYRGNQGGDSLHEMAPDIGLAAISNQTSNGPFSGDLGLAQPCDGQHPDEIELSRGYDSPVHHMHWSL